MSLRLGALHDALLDPGNAEKAQRAAEEVAAYDSRLSAIDTKLAVVQALLGVSITIGLGLLWLVFRLGEQVARLATTVEAVATKLQVP